MKRSQTKRVVKEKNPVGRPAILEAGKRVNVYLDGESLEIASELGAGNVSEGIRIALQQSRNSASKLEVFPDPSQIKHLTDTEVQFYRNNPIMFRNYLAQFLNEAIVKK